jgi:hypothetical protein
LVVWFEALNHFGEGFVNRLRLFEEPFSSVNITELICEVLKLVVNFGDLLNDLIALTVRPISLSFLKIHLDIFKSLHQNLSFIIDRFYKLYLLSFECIPHFPKEQFHFDRRFNQ